MKTHLEIVIISINENFNISNEVYDESLCQRLRWVYFMGIRLQFPNEMLAFIRIATAIITGWKARRMFQLIVLNFYAVEPKPIHKAATEFGWKSSENMDRNLHKKSNIQV